MDSDSTPHHHPHHHTQPIMMGPTGTTTTASNNSYPTTNANTLTTTSTTTGTAPPPPYATTTTTATHTPSSVPVMSQQHHTQTEHHQTQNPNPNNPNLPRFPFNSVVNSSSSLALDYSDGSASSPRAPGFSIEPARKKRGRPRKYSPDGNIALGLSPTPATAMSPVAGGHGDYSGGGGTASSDPPAKRSRGRPPGSGKKQLNALGNAGVGFTPHVITVKTGEDIASKVMAFAQQGPRTVCILSANGAICNVTLRQSAMSGGTVTYEGRFEIISLSGSFIPSETNGSRNRTGGLSVSLAGSDGRVLGGGVAGMLMAASPVQVVVGSFIADGKKPKSTPPSTVASNMLSFGGPASAASPPSQGGSSDSSDENGDSPINCGPGSYNNSGQPMSMPMYTNMGWPNNSIKMHPN